MLSSRFAGFRLVPVTLFALSMAPTESRAQSCLALAPEFGAPVVEGTGGSEPRNMARDDFNHDGFLDLAVLNVSSMEVSILAGSAGGFVLDTVLPPYSSAADVAAGDFNHDGYPDIVVSGDADDRVYVNLSDGSGGFDPAFGVNVGGTPTALAVGDFDDDGKLDIAVTANGDSKLFVLINNGVGGFPAPLIQISSIPPARQMAAADVDGDGILDAVTTYEANDELVVALGLGDGKFSAPTGFQGNGSQPSGLAVADFNKDGALDAVVVYETSAELELFRNDGSGSFFPTGTMPIGGGTYGRVATGDLNRDGILDLVLPDKGSKDINVFVGDGSGFAGPWVVTADTDGFDASIADFDRDGRNDFAVSHLVTNQVGLFSNAFGLPCPNPSFAELGRLLNVGTNPAAIVTGDLDRDGNLDFVVANQGGNTVSRYLGRGIGEFTGPTPFTTGTMPVSIAAGDFDSDGDLDVVTANQGSNNLHLHRNNGTGSFLASIPIGLLGTPVHVVAADVSGDGKTDLIVTLSSNNVFVLKNDGSGGFPSASGYIAGTNPRAVTVGDLNNDGLPDLAVSDALLSRIYLFRNVGAGNFVSESFYTISGAATAVKTAFMNGDGNLDLVLTRGTGGPARLEVHTWSGAFGFVLSANPVVGGGAGGPHGLEVADFNQDGNVDALVAAQEANRIRVFFGDGSGNFLGNRSEMTPITPTGVAAGDFNRDGLLDILAGQGSPTNKVLALMSEKQGTGQTFYSPDFLAANTDARGLTTADFNRDGSPDLVVANTGNDSVSYFRGGGNGTFNAGVGSTTGAGTRPRWLSAGDFDNDGTPDLVASAEGTNELVFLQGDGLGTFGFPLPSPLTRTAPYINRAADFNFDGVLDIAVITGSFVEVYLGDGFGGFNFHTDLSLGGAGSGLVVADFNRDGLIDIAGAQTADDIVSVFYGIDPGSWSVPTQFNPGGDPGDIDAADFNGDGFLDLVIPVQGSGQVRVALASGASFVLQAAATTGASPASARALDWNGDGLMDVVVASIGDHVLDFHAGDGSGKLGLATARPAGIRMPTWLAVGDFDMDSMPDVAAVPDAPANGNIPGILVAINSNCDMRQLRFVSDVSSCDLPGQPFSTQPRIELLDDGQNPLQCELGPLTASIVPGTGGGGFLLGNAVVSQPPPTAIVSYFNLGVSAGGGGYQLQFAHGNGLKRRSRTFSQGLSPIITGPAAICQGETAVYDGGPGYDMYSWFLDGMSKSMARTVDLTSSLTPGTRRIDLDVVRDSCLATTFLDVVVTANLSSVFVTPSTTVTVCANCAGPAASAAPTGGGAITYQWGYRTTSGGPITDFTGETASTYAIEGMDFPTTGNYFLVVTATPACGSPLVSNEVEIVVTAPAAPGPVIAFTALSTSGQNHLEWSYPAGCTSVRILRREDGTFPLDPYDTVGNDWVNGADFPCSVLEKGAFPDTALTNTTKYFYSAFVYDGFNFSVRRTVTGRPFDNSGKVKWAFSTGYTAMAQAGIRASGGESSLYIVSNDSRVYALVGGPTGNPGHWLPNAKPFPMGEPSQVRPPVVPFSVGTAPNGAAFVTSQDGNIYTLDADTLSPVWTSLAADELLGSASGLFTGFVAGAPNKIFVGTKNGAPTPNAFRAFDVVTGSPSWSFDNSLPQGGSGVPPGIILGGSSVDYTTKRAFFASRLNGPGSRSIWAIDVSGATPMHVWSQDIGGIDSSPVLLQGSPRRIVVGTNTGLVHLLEADTTGISMWAGPHVTGDGNVKGFVFPHAHSGNQYFMFSTVSKVTSIRHNGTGTNPSVHWQVATIPSPSIPLFLPGTLDAFVGGGNGVYRINRVDTTTPTVLFQPLGGGAANFGPPSFDIVNDLIYVGSDEGVIYAVERIFP